MAKEIVGLLAQLDLSAEEEHFARQQAGRVFDLLTNSFVDAYP